MFDHDVRDRGRGEEEWWGRLRRSGGIGPEGEAAEGLDGDEEDGRDEDTSMWEAMVVAAERRW